LTKKYTLKRPRKVLNNPQIKKDKTTTVTPPEIILLKPYRLSLQTLLTTSWWDVSCSSNFLLTAGILPISKKGLRLFENL